MTQFNPEKKNKLTFAEALDPAMKITDQEDADNYFEYYINYLGRACPDIPMKETIERARLNLGYYAGYYDIETRNRIEKLFKCQHPIFGSIEKNGAPTSQEALKLGIEYGRKIARGEL